MFSAVAERDFSVVVGSGRTFEKPLREDNSIVEIVVVHRSAVYVNLPFAFRPHGLPVVLYGCNADRRFRANRQPLRDRSTHTSSGDCQDCSDSSRPVQQIDRWGSRTSGQAGSSDANAWAGCSIPTAVMPHDSAVQDMEQHASVCLCASVTQCRADRLVGTADPRGDDIQVWPRGRVGRGQSPPIRRYLSRSCT